MYTAFTAVLLACAMFYAHQTVLAEGVREPDPTVELDELSEGLENITLPHDTYHWNIIHVLTNEIWCVWTLVNTAYCGLILLGKLIQKIVFGELRVSEQQHLKDKFWNFVFYKFIFIFGVMNVQTMEEVVLWVAWFSVLGFFNLLTQLSKDRFEYLSFSPTTPRIAHIKLLGLLCVVLFACVGLLVVCGYTGLEVGITIFAFMAAECLLLGLRALYVVIRYMIHLWDMNREGVWENRSSYVYYAELVFELAVLSVDFAHHLHMLLWGNIFLSMASLVICMQLRYLFYEFQRRVRRHKNYLQVVKNMEAKFPMASQEDLEKNADDCAICWEKMDSARKLPCDHLFHNSCLRSWLEQDTSCPTCRQSLSDRQEGDPNGNDPNIGRDTENAVPAAAAANAGTTNHFFHFDGSRYVSWLPSFSVEVTHTTNLLPGQQRPVQTSQLDNMARQVQGVFPEVPLSTIMDDLRVTRSIDQTIDNILEGRLVSASRPDAMGLQAAVSEMEAASAEDAEQNMLSSPSSLSMELAEDEHREDLIDDNITVPSDTHSEDFPSVSGSRFSKSASERMSMLEQRKTDMLEQARRRYLNKYGGSNYEGSGDEQTLTSSDDNRRRQREVILNATQRRLQQRNTSQS